MKVLRLKEPNATGFLVFDSSLRENGAMVSIEKAGVVVDIPVTLKQLVRIEEWVRMKKNEFFKGNGIRSPYRPKSNV